MLNSAADIQARFASLDLNAEAKEYLEFNAKRYALLLRNIAQLRSSIHQDSIRILDVGPSFFTQLLRDAFPKDSILSLGFSEENSRGGHLPEGIEFEADELIYFNLNDAQSREKWIEFPPCDLVVISEVIEHLYTAPTLVLAFLAANVRPGGHILVTVPNAAGITKRIALLRGKHPYEMIRENILNPGHFREYTEAELRSVGEKCNFKTVAIETVTDCYAMEREKLRTWKGTVFRFLLDYAPTSMRSTHYALYQVAANE